MSHSHFTLDQRIQIEAMLSVGTIQRRIAQEIDVSPAAISFEIKRNSTNGKYSYLDAHKLAIQRRKNSKIKVKTNKPKITNYIENKLQSYWSPQQISLKIKKDTRNTICTETIYRYIYENKEKKLWKYLRSSRSKRKTRNPNSRKKTRGIANRVGIEKRPKIVDKRSRIGDWELDTMLGAKHKGVIATFVERKSRYTIISKLENKSTVEMLRAVLESFKDIPSKKLKTMTSDNGREFACHQIISKKLSVDYYFADPYSSWQRGTNENTNGLIRQFLPKKQSLEHVSQQELDYYAFLLNTRPRLCLKGKTPEEVFNKDKKKN